MASIDIGSNSTLLLIAEKSQNSLRELYQESNVTSLGRDLDLNLAFREDTMNDTFDVLKKYALKAKQFFIKPNEIIATATEASRVAKNSQAFYAQVKNETGIEVKIITSEAEAYFSARGLLFDNYPEEEIIIMDIGGASTELIKVQAHPFKIIESISLPFGAVRMSQWIEKGEEQKQIESIFKKFNVNPYKTKKLFCVAGTMTSIANMHLNHKEFVESQVHNHAMSLVEFSKLYQEKKDKTENDYLKIYPFLGKRARTINGGMSVANCIFEKCEVESILISTYGLRYGTLLEGEIKDGFIAR